MTMASSTTMPIARTMPNIVDRLIEKAQGRHPGKGADDRYGTVGGNEGLQWKILQEHRMTIRTRMPA